jgi:c-di-AMP phosphodiesterase-like protein
VFAFLRFISVLFALKTDVYFFGNRFIFPDAIVENRAEIASTIAEMSTAHDERVASIRPIELHGCVFVGHTATDMDSIASAIGAAELFGGVAARASDINTYGNRQRP